MNAYLGVDIGSISTKGVVIDEGGDVLAQAYLWTKGDPVAAVKEVLEAVRGQLSEGVILKSTGTTGSARRLVGAMVGANAIKNEITAHAVGALSRHPGVRTIFEIGGQDSKIILIQDGIVADYAMNTLCAAGTGAFLSSQAERLGVPVEEMGDYALRAQNPVKIAARCTVFAESDMIHKAQIGHNKEDLIAGLCKAVVDNYFSNVGKGKAVAAPILFQGGVSKNAGVVKALEDSVGEAITVDEHAHLMGAIGAALLSQRGETKEPFSFGVLEEKFATKGMECTGCSNRCEVIGFYRNGEKIDAWGNRCQRGEAALGVE